MEQKVKIAIIGLVVLLFVSFIVILQINGSKQSLERQIEQLTNENRNLSKQAEDAFRQKRTFEDRVNLLESGLKKASQEKEELQKRYELVDKARQELIEQLNSLKAKTTIQVQQASSPLLQPQALLQADEAYWGGILKAKTDLEFQLESVRSELKNLQINNEQLQREKSALELDITAFRRDNQDLKRQIEYNQKTTGSITAELVREKNDKAQIQESLKIIKSEDVVLRRQLKSLSSHKVSLEKRLSTLQERNASLENRFTEMEMLLNDKMSQIEDIRKQMSSAVSEEKSEEKKESVELPPITVRPQSDTKIELALIGKVAAVNRDNNFVIVDFGQDSGVKIGDTFQVYRDDRPIANLEVMQTRKSIVACDIKKESVNIKVGDTVK